MNYDWGYLKAQPVTTFKVTHTAAGGQHSIIYHKSEILVPCCWSCHRATHITDGFPQSKSEDKQEGKPGSLWNLIPQSVFHHFCHILFRTSVSLGPVHTQGKRITQGIITWKENQWELSDAIYHGKEKQKLSLFKDIHQM